MLSWLGKTGIAQKRATGCVAGEKDVLTSLVSLLAPALLLRKWQKMDGWSSKKQMPPALW